MNGLASTTCGVIVAAARPCTKTINVIIFLHWTNRPKAEVGPFSSLTNVLCVMIPNLTNMFQDGTERRWSY